MSYSKKHKNGHTTLWRNSLSHSKSKQNTFGRKCGATTSSKSKTRARTTLWSGHESKSTKHRRGQTMLQSNPRSHLQSAEKKYGCAAYCGAITAGKWTRTTLRYDRTSESKTTYNFVAQSPFGVARLTRHHGSSPVTESTGTIFFIAWMKYETREG